MAVEQLQYEGEEKESTVGIYWWFVNATFLVLSEPVRSRKCGNSPLHRSRFMDVSPVCFNLLKLKGNIQTLLMGGVFYCFRRLLFKNVL